jgi:hypothetical protein
MQNFQTASSFSLVDIRQSDETSVQSATSSLVGHCSIYLLGTAALRDFHQPQLCDVLVYFRAWYGLKIDRPRRYQTVRGTCHQYITADVLSIHSKLMLYNEALSRHVKGVSSAIHQLDYAVCERQANVRAARNPGDTQDGFRAAGLWCG